MDPLNNNNWPPYGYAYRGTEDPLRTMTVAELEDERRRMAMASQAQDPLRPLTEGERPHLTTANIRGVVGTLRDRSVPASTLAEHAAELGRQAAATLDALVLKVIQEALDTTETNPQVLQRALNARGLEVIRDITPDIDGIIDYNYRVRLKKD